LTFSPAAEVATHFPEGFADIDLDFMNVYFINTSTI